ncbi:MAG TPA: 1,4-alpha-glucan branching protein GlgB [Methylomirabilota bacterium]|jgi:1,4-alpha-glucan branching enzyme|nr:1,4-alpha-glucan branching protein GlgB [Methylomirabilota bacterium]
MSLPRDVIHAIVTGDHGDPFAVLGPHPGPDGMVTVRAFLPDVREASVLPLGPEGASRPLARIHPAGLWEGAVPAGWPFHYRFRIVDGQGHGYEVEDPYRFPPTLTDYDLHLLGEGTHYRIYERLGAHPMQLAGVDGTLFAVWAPNARRVSVVGDWNGWDGRRHPMRLHPGNGVWELFLPGVAHDQRYKFEILARSGVPLALKSDPYAVAFEPDHPRTASAVYDLGGYGWADAQWMTDRQHRQSLAQPLSVYEVHLGSWRRVPEEGNRFLTYRELAWQLADYVTEMGFTHVELLPVMEHPFYGSWGYQTIGYYAPTRRYGEPKDFMAFVDHLHQRGIGVLLDWVPAHFPQDAHGLAYFDGSYLYEHEDPRLREHPDWGTRVFNYGRREVANFLLGNALFWLERYHTDGLRVDAVASMIYLDYSRKEGEWRPNMYGGRENLDAIAFIKRLNELVYGRHPDVLTLAEESTAWPQVSRPVYLGGLGFGLKWNMGWMHDVLEYMHHDPVHRKYHHHQLTFGLLYAWTENFLLPLSHDEVVHGKGSLLSRMPGDDWQRFANLRLLYGFMWAYPGKKLLFMGGEFGQVNEWYHDTSLDWHLLGMGPYHRGVKLLVSDLNRVYRATPALYERDFESAGFEWMDCNDWEQSTLAFVRYPRDPGDLVLCACNFTPVPRQGYRVGVPLPGFYAELVNTDAAAYGGSNLGNAGGVASEPIPWHGQPHSVLLTLPPLAAVWLRRSR